MIVDNQEVRLKGRLVRVAGLEAEKYKYLDNPAPMIEGLRNSRVRVDIFTFIQRPPDTTPKYLYPMEWDNLAVLPISTFEDWWDRQIGFKARNKAKQAVKKGVVIRETAFDYDLVKGIWEIYNECPVRQGRRFTHYGKSLEMVYREEATFLDSSMFLGAYWEGKLIGFIKLVFDETRTRAGLMNIISMVRHRDKAPTNGLIAQAVRSCAEHNISYLVYSNFAYGDTQKSSITDFKERNGFKRVDIPRYYVPLTRLGLTALRLRLHHRLTDHLPPSIVTGLRHLREKWYNRKLESAADAC